MSQPQAGVGVRTTSYPTIHNAPYPYEGNGSFSNIHLALLVLGIPFFIKRSLPLVSTYGGTYTYLFFVAVLGVPITIGYWMLMSRIGQRKNEKCLLPGKPIEEYMDIKDRELRKLYAGNTKIPMQVFHDAYFDGLIDIKGDVLNFMEHRHDWAAFVMTPELFKYVLFNLIPDILFHTKDQDQNQIRDNYDRGNDFYSWFLGPRMIYTCGVVTDINREETLEQLQDNKMTLVCEKLNLQPEDRFLDIGCGWGTLVAFAAKNYGCDATGITVAQTGAAFGTQRLKDNGVPEEKARILCVDYRNIPSDKKFTKIASLEMAEHVGIRRYGAFLKQVYDLLDDDGIFYFQVAGLRPHWQYEDLIWGVFMNKHIFPGADASCSLGWVITQLEAAGFEVKNIDVLGVHYSATIWRWYKNWLANKDKIVEKYGDRWYRIWVFFLAYSVIIAREGGSGLFQITCHKNLNAYHRIEGVTNHASIHVKPRVPISEII